MIESRCGSFAASMQEKSSSSIAGMQGQFSSLLGRSLVYYSGGLTSILIGEIFRSRMGDYGLGLQALIYEMNGVVCGISNFEGGLLLAFLVNSLTNVRPFSRTSPSFTYFFLPKMENLCFRSIWLFLPAYSEGFRESSCGERLREEFLLPILNTSSNIFMMSLLSSSLGGDGGCVVFLYFSNISRLFLCGDYWTRADSKIDFLRQSSIAKDIEFSSLEQSSRLSSSFSMLPTRLRNSMSPLGAWTIQSDVLKSMFILYIGTFE